MPRTNWADLAKFTVPLPPVETAEKFSKFFLPMIQKIRTNILESYTLAQLRDWLLPMLMNGQVTVG
ncbi:MAG: restriction endonuclease subunit S [bacterium]|nr:restriction endonuclease subunit S [bacterium]